MSAQYSSKQPAFKGFSNALVLSTGLLVLVFSVFSASLFGSNGFDWELLGQILSGQDGSSKQVFLELRLPRALLALLIGGSLALSGAVMQAIFRNPLADPGLIGVSAGSALGASVAIVLGSAFSVWFSSVLLVPVFAFILGFLSLLIAYRISTTNSQTQVATLLLAGVAISALCTALNALLIYLSSDQELRAMSFWQLGSFSALTWKQLLLSAAIVLPAGIVLLFKAQALNVLLLGDEQARHLGIDVQKLRLLALILTSLIVSAGVAMVGVIGFVGFIIPHLIRLIFGADHRFLLPASFLLGAWFLMATDTLARQLIYPAELPIGILTALIGCPFFIYLLLQYRKKILF